MEIATKYQAELLSYILDKTYPTGSVAYGLWDPKGHDRFCRKEEFEHICNTLPALGIPTPSDSGREKEYENMHSVRFTLLGIEYNIFVIQDNEIENIKLVTEFITKALALPGTDADVCGCKELRVYTFVAVRQLLRLFTGITCK